MCFDAGRAHAHSSHGCAMAFAKHMKHSEVNRQSAQAEAQGASAGRPCTYDEYFRDGRLVSDALQLIGQPSIRWVMDATLGQRAAVLTGKVASCVTPSAFGGRHLEETWAFWLRPQVGESKSIYHRFLDVRVDSTSHRAGALWIDFQAPTHKLAVMDSSHMSFATAARTATRLEDGHWYHYAISFARNGAATVYVNGCVDAEAQMEPPSQRAYTSLSFGNGEETGGAFSEYGFIGHVADLRHYNRCLAAPDIEGLANGGTVGEAGFPTSVMMPSTAAAASSAAAGAAKAPAATHTRTARMRCGGCDSAHSCNGGSRRGNWPGGRRSGARRSGIA